MTVCGIDIKGSEAIFALVDEQLAHCGPTVRKLALADDEDAEQVRAFSAQLQALVNNLGIQRLAIKKRSKKGEFAGGPITFKIEALLQLLPGCEVQLIAPQTLAALGKKHDLQIPASLNKYQHDAYRAACAMWLAKRPRS